MYAGIDCGTQSTKVVIFDEHKGAVIARGQAEHQLDSREDGTREQNPNDWLEALKRAFAQALSSARVDPTSIDAIGVSGQQHGLVVLDAADQVIRPAKLWCDTSTWRENAQLIDSLGGKQACIDSLGLLIATGYTASKICWLKAHEPENFARIRSLLLPHDYLNFWLTGEKTAEYGDASGTGYFDIRNRDWSSHVLDHIASDVDMRAALPRLVSSQEPSGRLRDAAARILGLKTGVLVASGGGDNMMGAIGTGNVTQGRVTMSLGTSGTIYGYMNQPCVDPDGQIAGFCSSSNGWLPLICTMNVTNVTGNIQTLLGLDIDEFNSQLDQAPVGSEGLVMLPFFNGERTPDLPAAKGSLHGVNASNLTIPNLCRAAVEGVSFGLRYGQDLFGSFGLSASEIRLAGGGAKSAIWRQLVADLTNTPVTVPVETEAAALGAALQAQWCRVSEDGTNTTLDAICDNGVKIDRNQSCEPNNDRVQQYEDAYRSYTQTKQRVFF
jgi:D-xylulose kinase